MKSWPIISERRTLIGIVCLAVVVALIGWRRFAASTSSPGRLPPEASQEADYSLSDFQLTLLDENGAPSMELRGSTMQHDPALERSSFKNPRARMQEAAGVEWDARAESGWVTDDGARVQLAKAVELNRTGASMPELTLKTDALMLYPKDKLARTDAVVALSQPGASLRGQGFSADFASGHYQLNAQVEGNYEIED